MRDGSGEQCATLSAAQPPLGAAELIRRGNEALHEVGNLHAARAWFDQAFRTAEREDDAEAMAAAAIGMGGLWVYEHRTAGPWAEALARQRRSMALLDPGSELALQLRIRLAAETNYRAGRHTWVMGTVQEARRRGSPQTLAMGLSLAHHCMLGPQYGNLRRELAEELMLIATLTGAPIDRLMGLLWRTVDLFLDGDPNAERSLAELAQALEASKHQAIGFAVAAMQVMLAIRAGDFANAERLATDCLRAGEACGDIDAAGWYQGQLTAIRWYQGRVAELLPMVHQQAKTPDQGVADNSHFAALAVMAAHDGDHRLSAGALARLGRGDLAQMATSSTWLVTVHGAVEAAFQLGDAETAAEAYALILPFAGLPVMGSLAMVCFGSLQHTLGVACLTTGETDAAVSHLQHAVRENLRLGHWPAACLSRYRLAEALRRRGRPGDEAEAAREWERAELEGTELGVARPRSGEAAAPGPVDGVGQVIRADPVGTSGSGPGAAQIQVRLLGSVDLSVDGVIRQVAGLRRKAVLAVLALHVGELVNASYLIDVVWGDQAPATATNTLQSHVSHLRRVFASKDVIRSRLPGYVLDLPPEATDVGVAERLIRLGLTAPDPADQVRHLTSAIKLWRGRALSDLPGLVRLQEHTERLNYLLLQAKQSLAEVHLRLGEHARVVEDLRPLTVEHPLHEQIHAQFMLALYRTGRQGDALAVYRRLRAALTDDLGIEPSQPLRDLETAILRQDAALDRP
jgi:DNA-binding SARP family transcriptional activator